MKRAIFTRSTCLDIDPVNPMYLVILPDASLGGRLAGDLER